MILETCAVIYLCEFINHRDLNQSFIFLLQLSLFQVIGEYVQFINYIGAFILFSLRRNVLMISIEIFI